MGKSGAIALWNTFKQDPLRSNLPIENGGSRIFNSVSFSLRELDYDKHTGGISVFAEARIAFGTNDTKKEIDEGVRVTDSIEVHIDVPGMARMSDRVQYMIAGEDTFYPHLIRQDNRGEQIRNALLATGVYGTSGPTDLPKFGLQLLSEPELEDLGVKSETILLMRKDSTQGFQAGLYRDMTSGNYVVAFAGTDDVPDILTDVWQGLGLYTTSYDFAMQIGVALSEVDRIAGILMTTGHSLGGGLASAASVAAGIRADTFNSAGLLRDTLLVRDMFGDVVQPPQPIHPGSLERYDNLSNSLIDAYYLDWDILSFFQDNVNISVELMQQAIGERHEMDGPLDFEIGWSTGVLATQLVSGVGIPTIIVNMGMTGYFMGLAHTSDYFLWGVMVDSSIDWDIYGYDL